MIFRTAMLATLSLSLACGSEQTKKEQNKDQQGSDDCRYFDIHGDAKITDMSEKDPYDAFNVWVSLEFRPSNAVDLAKLQDLVVGNSDFATVAALPFKRICIEANNVEVDSDFSMTIKKLSAGTCNPTIFRFSDFSDNCKKL